MKILETYFATEDDDPVDMSEAMQGYSLCCRLTAVYGFIIAILMRMCSHLASHKRTDLVDLENIFGVTTSTGGNISSPAVCLSAAAPARAELPSARHRRIPMVPPAAPGREESWRRLPTSLPWKLPP